MQAQKLSEASQKKYNEMKGYVIRGKVNMNLLLGYAKPRDGPVIPQIT